MKCFAGEWVLLSLWVLMCLRSVGSMTLRTESCLQEYLPCNRATLQFEKICISVPFLLSLHREQKGEGEYPHRCRRLGVGRVEIEALR